MSLRHLSVGKCLQTTSVVLKRNLFKLLLCCRYICVTEHSTNNSIFRKAVPSCPPPVSIREYFCKGSKGILMRNIFFFLNIFRVVPGSFFLLRRSCREITFRREWQKRERHLSLGWGQTVWRESRLARERRSVAAVCFDEGADYEGHAPESPAAIGVGGSFPGTSPSIQLFSVE